MADKYVMSLYGSVEKQFDNVFKPNKQNQFTGNRIMPLHKMTGGKRNRTRAMKKKHNKTKNSRRRRKNNKANKKNSKSKKGGYWGEVAKQAVVPLALLGMQQTYRKKPQKTRKNKTRRRH